MARAVRPSVPAPRCQSVAAARNRRLGSPPPQASFPERQAKLAHAFDKLMADVPHNLEVKTRDRFTSNLTSFRQELRTLF